ncbi:hypothetical protein V3C99_003722 [Haemonchus contortus]
MTLPFRPKCGIKDLNEHHNHRLRDEKDLSHIKDGLIVCRCNTSMICATQPETFEALNNSNLTFEQRKGIEMTVSFMRSGSMPDKAKELMDKFVATSKTTTTTSPIPTTTTTTTSEITTTLSTTLTTAADTSTTAESSTETRTAPTAESAVTSTTTATATVGDSSTNTEETTSTIYEEETTSTIHELEVIFKCQINF